MFGPEIRNNIFFFIVFVLKVTCVFLFSPHADVHRSRRSIIIIDCCKEITFIIKQSVKGIYIYVYGCTPRLNIYPELNEFQQLKID